METKAALNDRWRAEGREAEVAEFRARIREERKKSGKRMTRDEINEVAWQQAARAFPPLPPEDLPAVSQESAVRGRVTGLGDIPGDWPELPENASLQSELGWCQANRLRVVEELPSGSTRVHLDRAGAPAPSLAALGWLETSIRTYSKYIDVVAKSLATQQDEQEMVRRERKSIDEMRQILDEMNEQIAADMLADASATVRERVRSVVPDWCGRCGIDESQRQWLEGHVCQLAMDLLKRQASRSVPNRRLIHKLDCESFLTDTNNLPILACGDVAVDTRRHGPKNPTERI
jgi:hypothetical protein